MRKISNDELGRPTAAEFSAAEKMPVAVVLDNVRSLNNVGSFFRTCDAFAAERIVLCGITGTPPDREIHKTALGAEQTVAWQHFDDTAQALAHLAGEGYIIVAVEQAEGSISLEAFACKPGKRYALVFGNEVSGVSTGAMERCNMAIEIPQAGTKHSLNVAVSAGVVLWRFFASLYLKR